ncbi:MAG: excinuclease ABC subunit UvrA, partial [Pseudomonadota bacterium]
NLKNIDLDLPRDKFIVITGLSGSGKSSLAFDTLYAEGQRRYVESLSAYARQFLSLMEKPDVDLIEGLSPAISIEQKSTSHNPRSTVGTITEIQDYLRLLFARVGDPRCPTHNVSLSAQTVSQMVDQVMALPEGTKIMILAPVVRNRKGEHEHLFSELRGAGYVRARIDDIVVDLDDAPKLKKNIKHSIEVVIDRLKIRPELQQRLADSFETALKLADGLVVISFLEDEKKRDDWLFSSRFACPACGYNLTELEPRLFSFNNPAGACTSCDGLGYSQVFDPDAVVVDAELSLAEGAIRGWDRRNAYYFQLLESVAKNFGFDISKPFGKLAKKNQNLVLFGTGNTSIRMTYRNGQGVEIHRDHPFEGVIPNLERRYRESDSQSLHDELSKYLSDKPCESCEGTRLRPEARSVFIQDKNIADLCNLSIGRLKTHFETMKLEGAKAKIADRILKEIRDRLHFLVNVGLDYLSLSRSANTLSGGEAQRIRLASQIGAGLVGVMYVLDEPSIGLHQRDNDRLLASLFHLRDLGNTVVVVEHDEDAIRSADYIIDMGPGAGEHGGQMVAHGTLAQVMATPGSVTADYLSGRREIAVPKIRKQKDPARLLTMTGCTGHNLKNVTLEIPLGLMTCVTGVSGSGKSTLINRTLLPMLSRELNGARSLQAAPYETFEGIEQVDKIVAIDQSPIGRTPRSNPATYTGLFGPIRDLFAGTGEARARGYQPGRFSFNVKGGRCESCQGDGLIKVEMHFLPDIYVACDICAGRRYNRETLEVRFKGKNIHD